MLFRSEYMLRGGLTKHMLKVPGSMMLKHVETGHKRVVSIHRHPSNVYTAKHWLIEDSRADLPLPPHISYIFPSNEIYTTPLTVLPDHSLLDFEAAPFAAGKRTNQEAAFGANEESEYVQHMDTFYNPEVHTINRTDWLWDTFQRVYVPPDLSPGSGRYEITNYEDQRAFVSVYAKDVWETWNCWTRAMLDFDGPALEMIFYQEYGSRRHAPVKSDFSDEMVNKSMSAGGVNWFGGRYYQSRTQMPDNNAWDEFRMNIDSLSITSTAFGAPLNVVSTPAETMQWV